MRGNRRLIGGLTAVAAMTFLGQHAETAFAADGPWDEPIEILSATIASPQEATISADGRYVAMTNVTTYRPHLFDRSTGVLSLPAVPTNIAPTALMEIPDGSGLLFQANADIVDPDPPFGNQVYRLPLGSTSPELLTGTVDPNLRRYLTDSSFDGTKLAIELVPSSDSYPDLHTRVAVLDTDDDSLDYVDEIIGIPDLRTSHSSISSDGRYVAMSAYVGNCSGCLMRTYVVDRQEETFEAADIGLLGLDPNASSGYPELSADGRHVVFYSRATNLVLGTVGAQDRLYVRDLDAGTTELIADAPHPVQQSMGTISGDGQRIVYLADAPTYEPGDASQPFVYDRAEDTAHQLTVGMGGEVPNAHAEWVQISENGEAFMFRSLATNLVPGNYQHHIFLRGTPIPPPPPFVPLTPARLMESRPPPLTTVDGLFDDLGIRPAGSITALQVGGRGNVPVDAIAAVLNITVAHAQSNGHLIVFPCDEEPPVASNLNYTTGSTIANAAIAKLSVTGAVCIYTRSAVHLIVDVNGYFPLGSTFVPLTPARLMESRPPPLTTVDGLFDDLGIRPAGSITQLQVAGRGNVPADAIAAVLNITVAHAQNNGHLIVYPCDEEQPVASNLNYSTGATIANAAITKLSATGDICIYTRSAVHLIIDVNGYFPVDSTFGSLTPARLMESRPPPLTTVDGLFDDLGIRPAGSITQLQVAGRGNVPADAIAAVFNITVAHAQNNGHLTVFPCDEEQPVASNLNYSTGATIANAAITKLSATGEVCIYTRFDVHLIIDVNGYFPLD